MQAAATRTVGGSRRPAATVRRGLQGHGLGDLRRSREVTQVQLAERLSVSQATVSKFEKSNPAVSTVRRYVEALGGRLEITAVFEDDRVQLDY